MERSFGIKPMKTILSLLVSTVFAAATVSAGNLGPGPWANGAYYPGQFDGIYTASVYSSGGATNGVPNTNGLAGPFQNVMSGVVGFGIRSGGPTSTTNAIVAASIAELAIDVLKRKEQN